MLTLLLLMLACRTKAGPVDDTLDSGVDGGAADSGAIDNDSGLDGGADGGSDGGSDGAADTGADTGCPPLPWYADLDGDGFGNPDDVSWACTPPLDTVATDGDCDDRDATIHPGAAEICDDGVDQDCSGRADNTCPVIEGVSALKVGELLDAGEAALARPGWGPGAANALGDFDGDGIVDLATGDPAFDGYHGRVLVVPGPVEGVRYTDDTSLYAVTSVVDDAVQLGTRLAAAPDMDGDGSDELLVVSPKVDGADGTYNVGEIDLFHGPIDGNRSSAEADAVLLGDADDGSGAWGWRLLTADLNGDGQAELAVGSILAGGDGSPGVVYIFGAGLAGAVSKDDAVRLTGSGASAGAGSALASGDFDGDGVGDLAVSEPYYDAPGNVCVFNGPVDADRGMAEADTTLVGVQDSEGLGDDLAVGDMDGDGYADLAAGAPGYTGSEGSDYGAVRVHPGGRSGLDAVPLLTVLGESGVLGDGQGGMALLDLDLDGRDDLFISSPSAYTEAAFKGQIDIIYGGGTGTVHESESDRLIQADRNLGELGRSAAFARQGGSVVAVMGAPDWQYDGNEGAVLLLEIPGG